MPRLTSPVKVVIVEFEFLGDRPVLDFIATVGERGTTNEDKLQDPADLAAWIAQSGIVDQAPKITTAQFEHAKEVREALFRILSGLVDDAWPRPDDRSLINAVAVNRPTLRLTSSGGVHRSGDIEAVLGVLAYDCLELFDSPDREALHWCADPKCTRLFIDRSRGLRRRWCGMKGCGDRAKAAAYRERIRTRTAAPT